MINFPSEGITATPAFKSLYRNIPKYPHHTLKERYIYNNNSHLYSTAWWPSIKAYYLPSKKENVDLMAMIDVLVVREGLLYINTVESTADKVISYNPDKHRFTVMFNLNTVITLYNNSNKFYTPRQLIYTTYVNVHLKYKRTVHIKLNKLTPEILLYFITM